MERLRFLCRLCVFCFYLDLDKHHADAASHLTWRHMAHAKSYRAGRPELFRESGNEFQELVGAAMRIVHTAQHEYSRGSGGAAAGTLRACELDTRVVVAVSSSSEAAAGPVASSSPQGSPEAAQAGRCAPTRHVMWHLQMWRRKMQTLTSKCPMSLIR